MAKIVSVQIKNDMTKEILNTMKSQALSGLTAIGMEAEGYAKADCPVDTGRLRNSIAYKVEDNELAVYVGSNVEYAVHVEYRDVNHKVGKAHFIRDSLTNHVDRYKAILEAALK